MQILPSVEKKSEMRFLGLRLEFKQCWQLYVMLLLPVVFTFVYRYVPMVGVVMAFENYKVNKGVFKSQWVGLDNFRKLFAMPGFTQCLRNTVVIAVVKIILGIIVPVVYSLMLNEMRNIKVKRSLQTVVYMPHFISWVLMAGIISRMFSQTGMVNQIVMSLGYEPVVLLAEPSLFRALIWITDVWKGFGYGTIIYLAAITGIDHTLYEAAMVDGAGRLSQVWHVTLPGIRTTIILMTTLALGRVLEAGFDQIFNLYSPLVYETGDIIDTFVYRLAFNNAQFSMSAAAGLFKSAISCILIVLSYRIAYKTTNYRIF